MVIRALQPIGKTIGKMPTVIPFFRQNDTGSIKRAHSLLEKFVVDLVHVLESKGL